jgi:CheY-like chemotaxis protein
LKMVFRLPKNRGLILNTDIGLLKSVLMNLLSNAIKFTQEGGVLVSARIHNGQALLQVWDTGMGIPQENFAHIFDEFYQINNPQRDRNHGLGLGLSIVKRALTLLDSEIVCRTVLDKGSVFSFSLSLDNTAHHVPHPAANELVLEDMLDDSFTRGKKIVVVEDDALVAQGMISWLEAMGANVRFFLKAEDALAYEGIGNADCYVADYMLGGKYNGIEFLNRLREKLGRPVNAVLVTGDTSPAFVQAVAKCDWQVLYKPVNPARMIVTLKVQHELLNQNK